jgi:hypothetical protein
MSYLAGSSPATQESWEAEEGRYISSTIAGLSRERRLTLLLTLGLVNAIEISNRISIKYMFCFCAEFRAPICYSASRESSISPSISH